MKTKSPLPYFGSDSEVAATIAAELNCCSHVSIPFAGGIGIIQHLTAKAIVANDLNDNAINFFRVCKSTPYELSEECLRRLSHPAEIENAIKVLRNPIRYNEIERAVAYWAICWIGRKGVAGSTDEGSTTSVRWKNEGGGNATRITAAASDLLDWSNHFKRCEFLAEDFREFIPKVKDDETCGLYVDSPWVELGDRYKHSFVEDDHRTLRELLSRFSKAKVVVRYGDHPLIRELYAEGWKIAEMESRTQSNKRKPELMIVKVR